MAEPTVIDVVVNTDTRHPGLAEAIADIGMLAIRIDEAVGGKTALEALLCVYLNFALKQEGLAETRGALERAIAGLPLLDRARQELRPAQGTA
jgi:hypothetical protein